MKEPRNGKNVRSMQIHRCTVGLKSSFLCSGPGPGPNYIFFLLFLILYCSESRSSGHSGDEVSTLMVVAASYILACLSAVSLPCFGVISFRSCLMFCNFCPFVCLSSLVSRFFLQVSRIIITQTEGLRDNENRNWRTIITRTETLDRDTWELGVGDKN